MTDNTPPTPCLAVLGTGSEVGKSVVATALCRALRRRGFRVAPFKAQNMSNNSGVTAEGLEMGRAQIVQAEAAGIPPHVDMNPILLKPTSDVGSQVVLLGQVHANASASAYHRHKPTLERTARDALDRLRGLHEAVVLEGAGSCAEVNLMDHDLVNMAMAAYAGAPVVLVADIHKGGVFAQIVGTLACLPEAHRRRIAGFVVNRFRGDIRLFADGVRWIEERTGRPVFGVLPWFSGFRIEAEDSVVIEHPRRLPSGQSPHVVVIRLPHISNFNDFDSLQEIEGLRLVFADRPSDLDAAAAAILPGSKNTRHDLDWLHRQGWSDRLRAHVAAGGHVLGICGGYQMLGDAVEDPQGLEGRPGSTPGVGLLPVHTVLRAPKTTTRTRFHWGAQTEEGEGYEIHMGRTVRHGGAPLFAVVSRNGRPCAETDGCVSDDGKILGTYIHGCFDAPPVAQRWLDGCGLERLRTRRMHGPAARERAYERLADHFEAHVDVPAILRLMGIDPVERATGPRTNDR